LKLYEDALRKGSENFFNLFIFPEIKRRKNAGLLDDSFDLIAAQWIQYPEGRKNEIRLNSEVKATFEVSYKDDISKKKGDLVYAHEIKNVEWIELTDDDDPNCAHATYLKISGTWYIHFDFRQNKELARKNLHSSTQFLKAAEFCLEKKHWAPFLDTLFSAAELAVKSTQLMTYGGKFRNKTTHKGIRKKYNAWADLGNALPSQKEAFNKLCAYRPRVRYSAPDFSISEHEAGGLLKTVKEIIETAQSFARTRS